MPASIGVNMRVTGHYSQGGRLHMEDKFSVAYQQTEDERDLEYAYFGIFDGHGGSEAAAYAKDHLMEAIVRQRHFWSEDDADVLRAIRNGYMMIHMNMWKELEKWPKVIHGLPSTAGTTASIAFIRRGKIYIGHVGDSAIVLGYQVEGKEEWCAKPLTMDHKPESAAEMQRIQSSGGKVVPKSGVHRVVWNRCIAGKGKPKHEEIPFLAIARSLGDHWSYNTTTDEFVVSPDPDVGVLSIDPSKFRCLIFGTDGLWNMISPKMAVLLVQKAQKYNENTLRICPWLNPSKILVDTAIDRWANSKVRADNTSVVTVMMDPPGPPRNRGPIPSSLSKHPTTFSSYRSHDTEQTEKSKSAHDSPIEKALAKEKTQTNSDQNAAASVPSPVTPLPSMSNLQQYAKTPHMDTPIQSPSEEDREEHAITNYGNPAESYFIARLLNKTQIKNSLQHVYEEIMNSNVEVQEQKQEEFCNNNNNSLDKSVENKPHVMSPEPEIPIEKTINSSLDVSVKEETVVEDSEDDVNETLKSEDLPKTEQESIQINEVSSSSPIISPPKPRKRKSKGVSKTGNAAPQFPVRSLRSNNTSQITSLRPQTRFISDKNRISGESNTQKKNELNEPKVPVPVRFLKSTTPSSKVSISQPKLKLSNSPLTIKQNIPSKIENKKIAEKKSVKLKATPNVNMKQIEKSDVKTKPMKINENNAGFSRITRSKDVHSPSIETVVNESKKFQSNQVIDKIETDDSQSKNNNRPVVMKQKSNENNPESFFTTKTVITVTTRRNRDQNLGSNSECCKENMLTPVCPSPRLIPINSAKRRNSGGGTCDLEPKEKRRTRLGDKNNHKLDKNIQDQHEDVSSTESIKEGSALELSTCSDHNRVNISQEDVEITKKLNVRIKKITKCLNKNNSITNEISNEVHSTTLHIENECSTPAQVSGSSGLTMRALRPRHDTTPASDKKLNVKSEKRVLRSNNGLSELTSSASKPSDKESRPILRSRNSVGTLPSKNTPRRRVPWPQTLRHNLRKRFSK